MEPTNLVWLKRDLRTQDHAPLQAAEKAGIPYRIIYVFEPSILEHPDSALRHQQFIYHSIHHINQTLSSYGRGVEVFYGKALDVFQFLHQNIHIEKVFSHQETGVDLTWKRDQKINAFFSEEGIIWTEFQRDGIV